MQKERERGREGERRTGEADDTLCNSLTNTDHLLPGVPC